mmetsp:Transcript_17536/g.29561  ORF Transcript_17536/g.29561 Transcript_17536/m.29561 type:complete len:617 (-) Transcript_17536:261-2111(-)
MGSDIPYKLLILIWVVCFHVLSASDPEGILQKPSHRIAIGSCSNPNRGGHIWRLMENFHPEHLILLGDTIYVDHKAPGRIPKNFTHVIEKEYRVLTEDPDWQSLIESVNTWSATYDDHDYGVDNADKTFIHRDIAQKAFWKFAQDSFQGVDPSAIQKRSGVYSSKLVTIPFPVSTTIPIDSNTDGNIHGAEESDSGRVSSPSEQVPAFVYKVILLDSRSNKDPKGTEDGDFLGEEQWNWLIEEMADDRADLIILGSGIQVLTDDKLLEESWDEFPAARARLLKLVTAASTYTNVILLSGDIHRAEISKTTCSLSATSASSSSAVGAALSDWISTVPPMNIWEFTSSGLTHTLKQAIFDEHRQAKTKQSKRNGANQVEAEVEAEAEAEPRATLPVEDQDNSSRLYIPVKSRGFTVSVIDTIYQFAYPGIYREERQADHYAEVHFSLIDIVLNTMLGTNQNHQRANTGQQEVKEEKEDSNRAHLIDYQVVSHKGEVVSRKQLPLRQPLKDTSALTWLLPDETNPQQQRRRRKALLQLVANDSPSSNVAVDCIPAQGKLTMWQYWSFRAIVALALLIFGVIPLLAVLWFVGASIYYLCIGPEMERRQRIEAQYRSRKNK